MKISEAWLREWVNPSLTTQELAQQLTMAGLEINTIEPVAGQFDHVVIAQIMHVTPHPQADRLTLCDVRIAHDAPLIRIVCGARNVRVGLCVALAMPGAKLPGDIIIKISTLRGERSAGMLCSAAELGLCVQSEGILELADDAPLGMDLREYYQLNDHILDIDLTPNRADCFSVQGIAREVAALNQLTLNLPEITTVSVTNVKHLAVEVLAKQACPVYCVRKICGINPKAITPLWMQERLRRSGLRAIHPVVDVLNYVMLELGQPLHAFDAATVSGALQVRFAQNDESITLLDQRTLTLTADALLIADDRQALAVAGVMGGLSSAVQADTIDIILESAFFDPLIIAKVARLYHLCTDASQRFERGVDPTLPMRALDRATMLLTMIVGGNVTAVNCVQASIEHLAKTIIFNPNKVQHLTGIQLTHSDMRSILERLGMQVHVHADFWQVSVPTYRFDLNLDVDLVEEIVRLYGYDNIHAEPMIACMQAGQRSLSDQLVNRMSQFLADIGYNETINYAFVDPALQEELYPQAHAIMLNNPISTELSQMRVGLWPGLLAAMVYNVHRQQNNVSLFEHGIVFERKDADIQERLCLAGLLMGTSGELHWREQKHNLDFYDVKGDVQALFKRLSLPECIFVADEHPALHPGKTARILLNSQQTVGYVGILHPCIQDALDLSQEVGLFELYIEPLVTIAKVQYKPISKYPQVRRDLSLLVPMEITAAAIEDVVRAIVDRDSLKSVHVFDVYTGESVVKNKKSVAIACVFQRIDKTLIDSEVNAYIDLILATLETKLSVILREINGEYT